MNKTLFLRAAVAGLVGTVVASVLIHLAPLFSLAAFSIPTLYSPLGLEVGAVWVIHFIIGGIFGIVYAKYGKRIPFNGGKKGLTFGLILWFLTSVIYTPLVGLAFFYGSFPVAITQLIGFLGYGYTTEKVLNTK
jgi:hypothetical protein